MRKEYFEVGKSGNDISSQNLQLASTILHPVKNIKHDNTCQMSDCWVYFHLDHVSGDRSTKKRKIIIGFQSRQNIHSLRPNHAYAHTQQIIQGMGYKSVAGGRNAHC